MKKVPSIRIPSNINGGIKKKIKIISTSLRQIGELKKQLHTRQQKHIRHIKNVFNYIEKDRSRWRYVRIEDGKRKETPMTKKHLKMLRSSLLKISSDQKMLGALGCDKCPSDFLCVCLFRIDTVCCYLCPGFVWCSN